MANTCGFMSDQARRLATLVKMNVWYVLKAKFFHLHNIESKNPREAIQIF